MLDIRIFRTQFQSQILDYALIQDAGRGYEQFICQPLGHNFSLFLTETVGKMERDWQEVWDWLQW